MNPILPTCFLLLGGLALAGDISERIIFDDIISGPPNKGIYMPFKGVLDFVNLPIPNGECRVEFSLEVVNANVDYYNDNWELGISYESDGIELINHSELNWPGPHKNGDKFRGGFSFKTIKSGEWRIGVFIGRFSKSKINPGWGLGLNCEFCINQDGILQRLVKYHSVPGRCHIISTVFTDSDTVVLFQKEEHKGTMSFRYEVSLQPRPSINDTTEVLINLIANEDISQKFETRIGAQGIEILQAEREFNVPIKTGDTGKLKLKILPLPINTMHSISVNMQTPYSSDIKGKSFANIDIFLIFDNNKTLKYANLDGGLSNPAEVLPSAFREPNEKEDYSSLKITADGQIILNPHLPKKICK